MVGRSLCTAVVVLVALTAPPAGAYTPAGNRLVNSGAEDGLAGWQGAGFEAVAYDDGPPRLPAHDGSQLVGGTQLFSAVARSSSTISQIIDFSDLAGTIDIGQQRLSWGGLLGGRGGQAGAARLVVQPLGASGSIVGPPLIVGNPSDRDRQFKTALLPCLSSVPAPPGMRSVIVWLQAVGQGLADELYVSSVGVLHAGVAGFRDADGPGCHTGELLPRPGPDQPQLPALSSLLTMPASNRCRRPDPLRFRVRRHWRSQVASLEVRARGKRIVRGAGETITVRAPRGTLRVAISVGLRDGRESAGERRFSGCRG